MGKLTIINFCAQAAKGDSTSPRWSVGLEASQQLLRREAASKRISKYMDRATVIHRRLDAAYMSEASTEEAQKQSSFDLIDAD